MVKLSSDRYVKYLFHGVSRRGIAIIAGLVVSWRLVVAGWPWWAWVPAAILAVQLVYVALLAGVYAYQKPTYRRRAQLMKQSLREAGDENGGESPPQSPDSF